MSTPRPLPHSIETGGQPVSRKGLQPEYVPLCRDCVLLGQPRPASARERCTAHRKQWRAWTSARSKAVSRGTHTKESYEVYRPYEPRDLTGRAVVVLTRRHLTELNDALASVLKAKQRLDAPSRDRSPVAHDVYTPLLAALEAYSAISDRLLDPAVPPRRP